MAVPILPDLDPLSPSDRVAAIAAYLRALARADVYWRSAVACLHAAAVLEQLQALCQPNTD